MALCEEHLSRNHTSDTIVFQRSALALSMVFLQIELQLRDYALPFYSEVAKRLTCLFKLPSIAEIDKVYFEKSRIHMTLKGHLVRSKSELIIANMLYSAGIDYEYEKEFIWDDGSRLLPDFTIEDVEHDVCFYWEHCGMLGDTSFLLCPDTISYLPSSLGRSVTGVIKPCSLILAASSFISSS